MPKNMAWPGEPLLPGSINPCSRAGNTPRNPSAPGKDRGDNSPGGKKLIVYSNRAVADNLRTQIQKLKDKLETVKKLVEEGPDMNTGEDYQRYIDDWLGKLMNVLEAED